MKRAAAIVGPTPQFVRWAIEQQCPLRELDADNLPESTFNQLRSIKALSDGQIEGRVFERICVLQSVDATKTVDIDSARGFPIDEMYDLYGGPKQLDGWCLSCPANATTHAQPTWAGCYGWLAADSSWSVQNNSQRTTSESDRCDEDLPAVFESVIKRRLYDDFVEAFGGSRTIWFSLWRNRVLTVAQLKVLQAALQGTIEQGSVSESIRHILDATRKCLRYNKELHVELVPSGFSDGQTWTIFAHCPECKCVAQEGDRICSGCGRMGNPNRERNCKVLGFRPYLLLKHVLGDENSAQFLARYRSKRKSDLSSTNEASKRVTR